MTIALDKCEWSPVSSSPLHHATQQVMGESSEIALTYAKIFLRELSPKNDFLDTAPWIKGYINWTLPLFSLTGKTGRANKIVIQPS